ncbi:MAG: Abi family protein [Allomuricauda sp.]
MPDKSVINIFVTSIPRTPLFQAQFARLFFVKILMKYTKAPKNTDEHIALLLERELDIPNTERARKYLINVGYYRLTGYMYHLQQNNQNHTFKQGTVFNDIILHYNFDKKLRFLIAEYLERIEVALRSRLTDNYSINYGFYWYTDSDLFDDIAVYSNINNEVKEKFVDPSERFLKHFKSKYTSEDLPPSNMALEILSLGKLSRLYKGLKNGDEKRRIAEDFGIPSSILSSWLIYLTNIRNICAHHGRLWNRGLTADRFTVPKRKKHEFKGSVPDDFNTTMYGVISIVHRILGSINATNRFVVRIEELLDEYPVINTNYMGFPDKWNENATWK